MLSMTSCTKTEYEYFSSLNGFVTDKETGEPITSATVMLSPGGVNKLTGSDGYFEFLDITPDQYTITVQKSGYKTNRKSISTIVGENTEINITLTKE